ncbi:hypothetical protein ABID37_000233 [Aquamicrobium terrae]|uniref:Uncharacterized protein n=1 Tax=Aquamicrobium terrae TaxID=1324945 RepID=A0ABV2MU85_9HYPH
MTEPGRLPDDKASRSRKGRMIVYVLLAIGIAVWLAMGD